MPTDNRMRSGGGARRSRSSAGMLAWDIRQGRLIEEATDPKLTAIMNRRAASTIRRDTSGSPVVKLMTGPEPGKKTS